MVAELWNKLVEDTIWAFVTYARLEEFSINHTILNVCVVKFDHLTWEVKLVSFLNTSEGLIIPSVPFCKMHLLEN